VSGPTYALLLLVLLFVLLLVLTLSPSQRNTIKALNWYNSIREKLDDPK